MKLPVFTFGNKTTCTYCGDPATSRDHVIAVSSQHVSRQSAFTNNGPITHACKDCNNSLSNRYFETFKNRCEFIQARLQKKCKPIMWHPWEFNYLDHSLRTHVSNETKKRKWIQFRADFYGSRDFLLNIEDILWFLGKVNRSTDSGKFISLYFYEISMALARLGTTSLREDSSFYGQRRV